MNLDNLRAAMERRGWQAADLAAESGVDKSTLSLILSGKRPNNTASLVATLALALGVSVDYLLGLTHDPAPKRADLSRLLVSLMETASALPEARQRDLLRIAQVFTQGDTEQIAGSDGFEDKLLDLLERRFGRARAEEIYFEWARFLPGGDVDVLGKQRPA